MSGLYVGIFFSGLVSVSSTGSAGKPLPSAAPLADRPRHTTVEKPAAWVGKRLLFASWCEPGGLIQGEAESPPPNEASRPA